VKRPDDFPPLGIGKITAETQRHGEEKDIHPQISPIFADDMNLKSALICEIAAPRAIGLSRSRVADRFFFSAPLRLNSPLE
jgi:hypothetical protein